MQRQGNTKAFKHIDDDDDEDDDDNDDDDEYDDEYDDDDENEVLMMMMSLFKDAFLNLLRLHYAKFEALYAKLNPKLVAAKVLPFENLKSRIIFSSFKVLICGCLCIT